MSNISASNERARLQIFLSHAHVESRFADFLGEIIARDFIGLVRFFIASDGGIIAGEKWLEELTDQLQKSHLHVVLCSPESISRPWISFETGAALLRGIQIIPLCHSGLSSNQLPVPLGAFQGINLETRSDASGPSAFRQLYTAIAALLGSDLPQANFEEYYERFLRIQEAYEAERTHLTEAKVGEAGVDIIANPKALCVSSRQFIKEGFGDQIDLVLNAFPKSVEHHRASDLTALNRIILDEKKHTNNAYIVHIAAYVCPRSGDLYFSDVNFGTGEPESVPVEKISADDLAQLLNKINTQLVVVTGSDSLALTVALLGVCHVVAPREMVSPAMIATWVARFYEMLPRNSLSDALEFATNTSRAPMRLYAKQTKPVAVRFAMADKADSSID